MVCARVRWGAVTAFFTHVSQLFGFRLGLTAITVTMIRARITVLAVVAAITATMAVARSPAIASSSASTCGHAVIVAWSQSRLSTDFATRCYSWALQHLPPDVEGYSSASGDIQRQLLAAIGKHAAAVKRDDAAATPASAAAITPRRLLIAVGGMAGAIAVTTTSFVAARHVRARKPSR